MRLLFISSHPLRLVQPLQLLRALHCENVPYAAAAAEPQGLTISRKEQHPSSHISSHQALLDSQAVCIFTNNKVLTNLLTPHFRGKMERMS